MRVHRARNQTDLEHTTGNGECYRERGEHRDCREHRDEEGCSRKEEENVFYTSPFAPEVQDAIARAVPRNSLEPCWRCVFGLARELKGITSLASADPIDLSDIVTAWYQRAAPMFSDKCGAEECLSEFIVAWERVKHPKGSSPFDLAIAQLEVTTMPDAAKCFESPTIRRLVHLCYELQRAAGDAPFYLSSDKAAQIVDCQTMQAWRLLKLIEAKKVIKCIERGSQGGLATRWRYIESAN